MARATEAEEKWAAYYYRAGYKPEDYVWKWIELQVKHGRDVDDYRSDTEAFASWLRSLLEFKKEPLPEPSLKERLLSKGLGWFGGDMIGKWMEMLPESVRSYGFAAIGALLVLLGAAAQALGYEGAFQSFIIVATPLVPAQAMVTRTRLLQKGAEGWKTYASAAIQLVAGVVMIVVAFVWPDKIVTVLPVAQLIIKMSEFGTEASTTYAVDKV